jgi:DNA-binding transcriptional regulator LsrR (DeoR family)
MTGIRTASAALEEAKRRAKELVADAQAQLGREILLARAGGVEQKDIAAELKITREQVRRFQVAARHAGIAPPEDAAGD